jgi:hypothetical protein
VNYAYAAKRHRDGRNAGPSLTRSLGSFTGGKLKYFPNDDGRLPLEAMRDQDAEAFDTRNGFVLFDGNRAHEVEPFLGERYSLVWFTIGAYETRQRAALPTEVSYPTPEALRYFSSYIAGPRGYDGDGRQLTMRQMLGLQVKPLVLWMPRLSLDAIPQECLRRITTYTGSEKAMRRANKRFHATPSMYISAWKNPSIDVGRIFLGPHYTASNKRSWHTDAKNKSYETDPKLCRTNIRAISAATFVELKVGRSLSARLNGRPSLLHLCHGSPH